MKNIFCALFILLASTTVFGQGWERYFGTPTQLEQASSLVETPDGGFLLAMRSGTEGQLKKISIVGVEEWTKGFPTGTNLHVLLGANGQYFLAGTENAGGTSVIRGLDSTGNTLWEAPEVAIDASRWVALPDGYVSFFMDGPDGVQRWKVDLNGNLLWEDEITIPGLIPGGEIIATDDGGFVLGSFANDEALLSKFDGDGNLEWDAMSASSIEESGNGNLTQTADGGYLISIDLAGPEGKISLNKFSATGDFEWNAVHEPPAGSGTIYVQDLDTDADGNFIMVGRMDGTQEVAYMLKYSGIGDFLFYKEFNGNFFNNFVATDSGFYCAAGRSFLSLDMGEAYMVLTNYSGQLFPNAVQGEVLLDEDNDCTISAGDLPLNGWLVAASGANTYHGITDENGQYFIELDTGEYTLSISPPNDLWAPCENPVDLSVALGDTLTSDFPVQAAIECPAMQVDISRPFLRRCFDNVFTVQYCNYGTVPAEDATIDVTLDSLIEYVGSSLPVASQNGNVFTFSLGDVGIMECGSFNLTALVSCEAELGQTLCFEAHAFPDSICGMPFNYSGASMVARAKCEGDTTVLLELENVGTVPTSEELEYIVIEDEIIFFQDSQIFEPGMVEPFPQMANGATWRIICEQEPNHPGFSFPTAFVEGCGENNMGNFSVGFVNEHPLGDGNGFVDMDCEEVVGAFDPNDKSAQPTGYGDEHFIEPNTDIEYRIRFQNTGTDTAFNVVIRDTLSPFLDPTSLRPGASSHPYQFDLTGNGIAVFTFPNIMLPDSNVNEALSHGFVTFKISQMPDLAPETVINNSAAIYFDFNEPIITNTTFHTIERDFIISASVEHEMENIEVKVFPNPFAHQATFEVEGVEDQMLTLRLFDGMGRLVRSEKFNGNQLIFQRKDLRDGIWFFQIESEGRNVGGGKLVVVR